MLQHSQCRWLTNLRRCAWRMANKFISYGVFQQHKNSESEMISILNVCQVIHCKTLVELFIFPIQIQKNGGKLLYEEGAQLAVAFGGNRGSGLLKVSTVDEKYFGGTPSGSKFACFVNCRGQVMQMHTCIIDVLELYRDRCVTIIVPVFL